MFGKQELTELRLRKQTLVLESELNRMALQSEWEHLRTAGSWLNFFGGGEGGSRLWPLAIAPLAGVALALGFRRSRRLLASLATVFTVLRPLIRFWRSIAAPFEQRK